MTQTFPNQTNSCPQRLSHFQQSRQLPAMMSLLLTFATEKANALNCRCHQQFVLFNSLVTGACLSQRSEKSHPT
jgi:hypothetical protein